MVLRLSILLVALCLGFSALGHSENPCADDIQEYCGDLTGEEINNCMARKLSHVNHACSVNIYKYYRLHPDEKMPDPEDNQVPDSKKETTVPYGVPSWNKPQAHTPTDRPAFQEYEAAPILNVDPWDTIRRLSQGD